MNFDFDSIRKEIADLPEKAERRSVAKAIRVAIWLGDRLAPTVRAAMVEAAESYEQPKPKGVTNDV